jgi:nucleoid-associated protein YgaU
VINPIPDLGSPGAASGNNTTANSGNTGAGTVETHVNPITPMPEGPVVDGSSTSGLSGRSWHDLLNGGAGNINIITPRDTGNATVRNVVQPARDNNIQADPPAASGPRRYVVKQGESFWSIAQSEYGNGAYFPHILRANPGVDPQRVRAGTQIVLPNRNDVVAAAAPRQPQPAAAEQLDANTQYRVQSGDNLSVIAKKLYGRYDKWLSIYEHNKELIGPNPAVLKNGMILRLPETPLRIAGSAPL